MESLFPTNEKPPNRFTIAVGGLVKAARQDAGLTQGELARLASVHRNTISNVEAGKVELSVSTLVMLSQVLDRPLSYFIPIQDMADLPDDISEPSIILLEAGDQAEDEAPQETGLVLVQSEVPGYDDWKAVNALKLAQVLAWIGAYSTLDREPTDAELSEVRDALLQTHAGRQEFSVKEIGEEWIRQNGGASLD